MRVLFGLWALAVLALAAAPAGATAAEPGPAWSVAITTSPTVFAPGDSTGSDIYTIVATNVGSEPTDGSPITIADLLPAGLSLNSTGGIEFTGYDDGEHVHPCDEGPPATCTFTTMTVYEGGEPATVPMVVQPGQRLSMRVPVDVDPSPGPAVTSEAIVSGGGAPSATASVQTQVASSPPPFGLQSFKSALLDSGGAEEARAGSHPYQMRIGAQFITKNPGGVPVENPHDIVADLPAGLVVNPRATATRCKEAQLETINNNGESLCPAASAIGTSVISLNPFGFAQPFVKQPVFNLVAPGGRPAAFGMNVAGYGIIIHLLGRVRSDGDYGLSSDTFDAPDLFNVSGVTVELWGDPSDPSHDYQRGSCAHSGQFGRGTCPTQATDIPLLTMPSACSGPLESRFSADSWQHRGTFVSAGAQTEDQFGNPAGVNGCDKLPYTPTTEAKLTTDQAETGTSLDFGLDFPNDGWESHEGLAESTTKKAVVTLPQGMTINPSVGEGLGFCTPAQYAGETTFSADGEGCPADSKLGTVHVDTPLLDQGIDGSVYLAQQDDPTTSQPGAENPFDTDIALYFVLRSTELGVMVKKPMKVVADPGTGQLVASIDDIPQLPFSHFSMHFKEGARPALITPSACGRYTTLGRFYPHSDPANPRTATAAFEVTKGVGGGPCPPAGIPPFKPGFEAGSINNNAKSYSPFNMRLTRADGEQDMTKFSSVLPPGVLGKLAGVSKCSDAAIASAKAKTGRQEKASPSCPANSQIGRTLAGAGVGDSLTYVPGQLYLAGPYHGDPLSVVSITPALAGPFDAGTVVVRIALNLNPETAEVEADGSASDPIPHILKGIVLKVRDLRVYVDRPEFILNPTSCDPSSAKATLFGAYQSVFDPSDDVPVGLATRFQAANCLNLGFKPKLAINLKGGTRRGGHPALKAVVNARATDANIGGATVTLPRSAFLDQAHIRTICTRVQYAANGGSGGGCPKGAQYGYARAYTPLLDEPVEGPVYLRSSNHKLPDLVAALHGIVDVDIVGRIDSFRGGIRSSFESVPDAPVSKFVLTMQGGRKGLVVNSRNLCGGTNRADAQFDGQNGRAYDFRPVVKPSCKGKAGKQKRHGGRG